MTNVMDTKPEETTTKAPQPQPVRKRYWRRLTIFTAICAAVAVGYLGYKVFLISSIGGVGTFFDSDPAQQIEIGCPGDGEETKSYANSPFPVLPTDYQKFISGQPNISGNLATNASMQELSDGTPKGYQHITDGDWTNYEFLHEAPDNKPFLRTTTSRPVAEGEVAAGWIMDSVPIEESNTYSYSFSYRSTAPVVVSVEFTMADGQVVYQNVAQLDAHDSWQSFTAYSRNPLQAKAFRFIAVTKQEGQIDLRSFEVHRIADAKLDEGLISIAFDDGWQSVNDHALPLLEKYGFKTTQFIISEAMDNKVIGYMDTATVKKLKEDGHEIGSHTKLHCDQTNLSDADMVKDAQESRAKLEKLGLGSIDSFAYPYGAHNQKSREVFAGDYAYLRSSDAGYNDSYFDVSNIRSMGVLNTTSDKQFESWLKYAAEQRLWLVVVYHRIDERGEYSLTSDQFEKQLNMIQDSGLTVLPLSEAAKTIGR